MENKILEMLRKEKRDVPYPDGSTSLLRFICEINKYSVGSHENVEFQRQLVEVAKTINKLSVEAIQSLFILLYSTTLLSDDFSRIVATKKIKDASSRAQVMRFLATSNLISTETILADKKAKKTNFWIWVDALVKKSWPLAVLAISEKFSSPDSNDVKKLMARLYSWRARQTSEEFSRAIDEWLLILQGSDKEILERWIKFSNRKK